MLCRAQPFGQLTDEQVIENAGEFFRDQGRQVREEGGEMDCSGGGEDWEGQRMSSWRLEEPLPCLSSMLPQYRCTCSGHLPAHRACMS